ncbi:FecR family protein [Parabacteroides faecis]|uniref:Ferric-dicitrate binding protein FerR (Iron transport regulator) n=1 Tax=Parabacteroides faecis TaxID=1217282 RepID=A0ABR6KIB7_9BACT|nr:FecR family protein [Parabacteroides faecis]MBB4621246.1 ferric-dicitrate binding protein FerR (iron transport regulator) [Parabacteroides faecis]
MEPDNKDIKEYLLLAKAINDDIVDYENYNIGRAFLRNQRRIASGSRKQRLVRSALRIAAVLLLPFILSTGILSYLYIGQMQNDKEVSYLEVVSAPGVITKMELPDKSKVWLNAGSSLRYPSRFTGNERNVYLSGEGYFEVQSDKQNPFYVSVNDNMKIMAHGTKFNVNAYGDEQWIETTLETGLVDVIMNKQSVLLEPSELAYYDRSNQKLSIRPVNVDEKTAWKDGRLIFRNTSLDEVVKQLSRRYNVDIVMHKRTNIDYKCRASFSTESITQILDYLKLVAPMKWKIAETKQLLDSTYPRQRIDIWLK